VIRQVVAFAPDQWSSRLIETDLNAKLMIKKTAIVLTLSAWLTGLAWGAQTTFTKITSGPVVNDGGSSFACAWGDYDNDGFLDLFVTNTDTPTTGEQVNFLYHNNRDGTFTRITTGAVAKDLGQWQGCAWADFDNDGRLDLLAARVEENVAQVVLYRNDGSNTFTRMPANTIGGIIPVGAGASQGSSWADYDNDGWVDLFVNRWGIDWLYRNNGDGSFTRTSSSVVGTAAQDGFTAGWVDYNNDGRPDLFVAVTSDPPARRLYQNLGGGAFAQITSGSIVTDGGKCFGSAWADYDNDGFLDLFLVNGLKGEASFLYHNNGNGTFTRMTSDIVGSIASDPGAFSNCAWGDYDNDGFLDLFVTATPGLENLGSQYGTTGGNALYHNNGDGSFTRILTGPPVEEVGNATGCAWGDYDKDGFLDLFVAHGGIVASENNALYHNNGNANNWLKVKCVGTVSNRSAIGAKVRAQATLHGKTTWQLREINSGNGICQNPLEAHFGLADATKVETLRIEWPSGIVQEFHDVAAKQFLTITEPPRLQATVQSSDGSVQLALTGGLGFAYDLQRSIDLAQWTLWTTLTNTSRTMTITETNQTHFLPKSFYRAVFR
jgi:ASPIC and UnbV/FG-GAP-like repeat